MQQLLNACDNLGINALIAKKTLALCGGQADGLLEQPFDPLVGIGLHEIQVCSASFERRSCNQARAKRQSRSTVARESCIVAAAWSLVHPAKNRKYAT